MSTVALSLRFRPPFLAGPLLTFLGNRAIPGVEEVVGSTYRRSLATRAGSAVIALTPADDAIALEVTTDDPSGIASVVETARALFDLGADPGAVARTLERDALLRPLVRANAGIRLPGAADGFEMVVRAILGQQVSVAAARTMLGRVAARFGTALPSPDAGVFMVFPTAARLSDAPLEELGITRRRAAAIRRVATMVAAGLEIGAEADRDATARALLEVDGIGPWTAEYVRMRALRDPDAFLAGDLGIRRAMQRLGVDPTPGAIAARAEAWRPWRAYAAMLLWLSDAERGDPNDRRPPR